MPMVLVIAVEPPGQPIAKDLVLEAMVTWEVRGEVMEVWASQV